LLSPDNDITHLPEIPLVFDRGKRLSNQADSLFQIGAKFLTQHCVYNGKSVAVTICGGKSVPRDRNGDFEPQVVKKHQTALTGDIEEKILSMYAKGMSTSDIEGHIREIYGLEVSDTTISRITNKLLPVVREWQQRPLESMYAVVFMDGIYFHVRSEGQIIKKADT